MVTLMVTPRDGDTLMVTLMVVTPTHQVMVMH